MEASLLQVGMQASIRLRHEFQRHCGDLMLACDTHQHSLWHASERFCVNARLLFMKIGLLRLPGELASATHGHRLYYVADASIRL